MLQSDVGNPIFTDSVEILPALFKTCPIHSRTLQSIEETNIHRWCIHSLYDFLASKETSFSEFMIYACGSFRVSPLLFLFITVVKIESCVFV